MNAVKSLKMHKMTTISFKLVKVVILSEKVVILLVAKLIRTVFEIHNNIARYNLINSKYRQMEFQSPSDGAPISPYHQSFGTPGQTKVSGEICYYYSQLFFHSLR